MYLARPVYDLWLPDPDNNEVVSFRPWESSSKRGDVGECGAEATGIVRSEYKDGLPLRGLLGASASLD